MKKLFQNIFYLVFILSSQIFSQQFSKGSPEWLVDMFFNKNSFPDKADYFTGEMLNYVDEETIGEELNGEGEVYFHQVKAKPEQIVFAIEIKQNQSVIDLYCYLIKIQNDWKINAVRRFLLPAFIYSVRDSLSQLNTITKNDSAFYLSLQLFTSTDSELKSYLRSNVNHFQKLVSSFNDNLKEQADTYLTSLGCNAIYTDKNYPGCVFVQILKFEDMEAGFIFSANGMLLPEISVNQYIYIEEVVQGWLVYREM